MKDKFTVASPTSVQSIGIRLRERAKWLESRSFATLDASIEREAASTIDELLIELEESQEACKGWMEKTIELQKRIEGGRDESKQCTE